MNDRQHINNKIGNAVGERKKDLYKSLNNGADLKDAIARFIYELQRALHDIVTRSEGGAS